MIDDQSRAVTPMRFPRTFLLAFVAASLLMLACAWLPKFAEIAVMIGISAFFFGGFAALAIQVGMEFAGRRILKIAGVVFVGFILSIAAIGWTFNIFPYIWNGVAVLLLGLAVMLLAACLFWRFVRDYLEMFLPRKLPVTPANWHSLEEGELPATGVETSAQARQRFAHSYGVNITCTPRAGPMGLISHPLRMDE